MDAADYSVPIDHTRWARLARRHWMVVALTMLLGAAAGAGWEHLQPLRYQATAKVSLAREAGLTPQTSARFAANELERLGSPSRIAAASEAAGGATVQVTAVEGSDVASVRGTASNGERAEAAVKILIDSYVQERTADQARAYENARAVLEARLAEIEALRSASPPPGVDVLRSLLAEGNDTRRALIQLEQDNAMSATAPYMMSPPTAVLRGSSPVTLGLAGLVAGLVLGILLAVWLDARLSHLRGEDDEVAPGLPGSSIRYFASSWDDMPPGDRDAYLDLARRLIASPGERHARTAILPMDSTTPSAQFAGQLAEVIELCGATAIIADLVGAAAAHQHPRHVDLSELSPHEQLGSIRKLVENAGHDLVLLIVAGPITSPSQITASRAADEVLLVAHRSTYSLKAIRRVVRDLVGSGIKLNGTVALPNADARGGASHRSGKQLRVDAASGRRELKRDGPMS